ncbi:MAG: adenosylmethionine decarboxylase [Pseudomonadota bacterium]
MSNVHALFQSGIDLGHQPSASHQEEFSPEVCKAVAEQDTLNNTPSENGAWENPDDRKDFFIEKDGERFAGTHLIVDLWDAKRLDELDYVEETLRDCVEAAGATLLHIHLHHFTPNDGISGVAVLAESHISIHSWPENGYAALDVFMCGAAEPHKAVEVLRDRFQPSRVDVGEHRRGRGL